MRVTQLGCLQNQTAFDTSRNDCVAICSNNGHSFGAGYGKFYTRYSDVFSLHDFPPPPSCEIYLVCKCV